MVGWQAYSLVLEFLLVARDSSQPSPPKGPAARRVVHVKIVSIPNPRSPPKYASLPEVGLFYVRRSRNASKIPVIDSAGRSKPDDGPRSPRFSFGYKLGVVLCQPREPVARRFWLGLLMAGFLGTERPYHCRFDRRADHQVEWCFVRTSKLAGGSMSIVTEQPFPEFNI